MDGGSEEEAPTPNRRDQYEGVATTSGVSVDS
jgi:hypothetical protein